MTPDSNPTGDGASARHRYSTYIFDMAAFEVEGNLFHVPKNGFIAANPNFFSQLSTPVKKGSSSEENPIELKGVTAESFYGLLLVLYPFQRTASTYEEWLGALELTTKWNLGDIRTKAIDALATLNKGGSKTTVEIALLAKRYHIKPWLRDAYAKMVKQTKFDSESLHQNGLDWETIAGLLAVRDTLNVHPPTPRCYRCNPGPNWNIFYIVVRCYCDALRRTAVIEKTYHELDTRFAAEFKELDGALIAGKALEEDSVLSDPEH